MSDPLVSYGWCMPSDPIFPLGWVDVQLPTYPDDCGGPHIWEPMTSTAGCDCPYCTYHYRWLECENCLVTWYEDGTDEWLAAWNQVRR